MPLKTAPSTQYTPNPASPAPALPVPALPPAGAAAPLIDVKPAPDLAPVSYPAPQALTASDFIHSGLVTGYQAMTAIIDLPLSAVLSYRKLYAYLTATNTNANYAARLVIEFWRNYTKVGELPLATTGGTVSGEAIPTVFCGGGNAGPDTLALFNLAGDKVLLQPQYIHAEIDRVTVTIRSLVACSDVSAWVGVISSLER
jgi:hypothetical protein